VVRSEIELRLGRSKRRQHNAALSPAVRLENSVAGLRHSPQSHAYFVLEPRLILLPIRYLSVLENALPRVYTHSSFYGASADVKVARGSAAQLFDVHQDLASESAFDSAMSRRDVAKIEIQSG